LGYCEFATHHQVSTNQTIGNPYPHGENLHEEMGSIKFQRIKLSVIPAETARKLKNPIQFASRKSNPPPEISGQLQLVSYTMFVDANERRGNEAILFCQFSGTACGF